MNIERAEKRKLRVKLIILFAILISIISIIVIRSMNQKNDEPAMLPATLVEDASTIEKGAFIQYDVSYTDIYTGIEYTSTNGWRIIDYKLQEDGKTLYDVKIISAGIPAMMDYNYNDQSNNYAYWETDETDYALQATAGYYYNLEDMTFDYGISDYENNMGYFTSVRNGNNTYTRGSTGIKGAELFKTEEASNVRILTLPEVNTALGRTNINSQSTITTTEDSIGLYRNVGTYWLASPTSNISIAYVNNNGNISGTSSSCFGIRPVITLESAGELTKVTDTDGNMWHIIGEQQFVEEITLDAELNINKPQGFQKTAKKLTATVLPENATIKDLEWTSSNEDVATVDENGTVIVLSEGTTTITARAKDGSGVSATREITVEEDQYIGNYIQYDVSYTDTYTGIEYTDLNGWRILDYKIREDGKTLYDVKIVSTGIPAMMNYDRFDKINNYVYWVKDKTKLNEFKTNVLGENYGYYTGTDTDYALQATAGLYYNLEDMTFDYGISDYENNMGYFTNIRNGSSTYTSESTGITGAELFKTEIASNVRILTLPEVNTALGRTDLDSTNSILAEEDGIGLYRLDGIKIDGYNYHYLQGGWYWLASPYPEELNCLCLSVFNGTITSYNYSTYGIRPVISLETDLELTKVIDTNGNICYMNGTIEEQDVTQIVLDKSEFNISKVEGLGKTEKITATVLPENATNKSLTWTSSNEEVATVDQYGNIAILDLGTTIITATAKDGSGVSATCEITVEEDKYIGRYIKYDVSYIDMDTGIEYSTTNGWRILDYKLREDGKTLYDVEIISTGIPARYDLDFEGIYYPEHFETTIEQLNTFKTEVLGSNYAYYTGSEIFYTGLYISAGFYYNLGNLKFDYEMLGNSDNRGYFTSIKNGSTTYANESTEITGERLFKTEQATNLRMLTLPELNTAIGRADINSTDSISEKEDTIGLFNLSQLKINGTSWSYYLASPVPWSDNGIQKFEGNYSIPMLRSPGIFSDSSRYPSSSNA